MSFSARQKCLVVDRSELTTIKFKNGFPPKMISSRKSFHNTPNSAPHERVHLVDSQPRPLKSGASNTFVRKVHNHKKDIPEQKPSVQSIPSGKRPGFAPSTVKQGKSTHQKTLKAPFSPPPTLSELKSLTKKIGRFYTVKNNSAWTPCSPGSRQKAILDIEKALSEKDLKGLEKCYRRLFNGSVDPIRAMVRNQTYPNQRSRQAMCPVVMHGATSSSRSSPIWSRSVPDDAAQRRRWSIDGTEERLPIVPAPYFKRDSTAPYRTVKVGSEGPVMFSSTRQDYREKMSTPPSSTVTLNLDPERFPEPTVRSPQLEKANQDGPSSISNLSPTIKKPIGYKPYSQWTERAPNSTPEPHLRNDMQIHTGQHRDLLPQVFPAQFRYNSEQRSIYTKQINCKAQGKLSKNSFDTREASTEPQSSEAISDRNEITEDGLTERKRVLTSGDDRDTDCDYNEPIVHSLASNKSANEQEFTSRESSSISSEDINQKVVKVLENSSPEGLEAQNISKENDEIFNLTRKNSMVENIDLQKLEINCVRDSSSETSGSIVNIEARPIPDSSLLDSRTSLSDLQLSREIEMSDHTEGHMESVNAVVVNVTTDEGEDVNADIYEYEKGKRQEHFEVGMDSSDEVNKENAQPVTRNRKEELEALLKEHSSIVEEVKHLSESFDV